MSDLTDNKFNSSVERIWLCIRLNKWACDRLTEDADSGKKKNHLFRWNSFWSWRVCKQEKLSHLGHRKPARIHWKADAPKTRHCLVRILLQMHNWAIFLGKWARRGSYSQWQSYWQHLVSTGRRYVPYSRSYNRCFAPVFEDRIFSRRADVVWPPRTCDLTSLVILFGEIQLHTIVNVLKNWSDHVVYCMASRGRHLKEIIFHY